MKQDRFLTGILIGIGALIIIAVALFFVRKDAQMAYVDDATPEGVTHNYAVAVYKKDYEKAYAYLADKTDKPTLDAFRRSFTQGMIRPADAGLDIGSAEIHGDDATVTLSVLYNPSDPFSSGYNSNEFALLTKQADGWKLYQMPYNYWDYSWYQPAPKP
jgi:hypothetical protein